MAKTKKQGSNLIGWAIIGLIGFGIVQFGVLDQPKRSAASAPRSGAASPAVQTPRASVPLDVPRFVNVASLNVRHAPEQSAPLVTVLPRGTGLRVLGRQNGWLLVDLGPTLEGWVAERLTTTETPRQALRPPARVPNGR